MPTKAITNRYAGTWTICGQLVEPGAGIARKSDAILYRGRWQGGEWLVSHRPTEWAGSPVSGRWVGGCPRPKE